jgi:MFS family permease
MYSGRTKAGIFALAGLNSISTTYYFYYIYFFMQERFGFDRMHNLILAAALGLIYTIASVLCGRFAQRHGYFLALRLGFFIMAVVLAMGGQWHSIAAQLAVVVLCDIGMCFTWPTLEAMVSEGESPAGLQRMVGIYNLVWAGGGALAYFTGGAMLEHFGLESMFWVPSGMQWLQLVLALLLGRTPGLSDPESRCGAANLAPGAVPSNPRPIARARAFLRMAWLANPFAYLAINTIIAVIPSLARDLKLSHMFAGFFCSVWLFVRVGAFALLWRWAGWHYRFSWLLGAYAAMVAGFALILLVPNLLTLLLAQVVFGLAVGLIYYSSLYYSMDLSETKSEHGGLHEAAIGAGSCAGPAVGAIALHFFPDSSDSSVWAVSGMLLLGLGGLAWLRGRR